MSSIHICKFANYISQLLPIEPYKKENIFYYSTPVKIWAQNTHIKTKNDGFATLYLQFVMSITYAEHDEMMNCKMELMLPVIDIKLPNKGNSLPNTGIIPKLSRLISLKR